jgi:hypothetical protein
VGNGEPGKRFRFKKNYSIGVLEAGLWIGKEREWKQEDHLEGII